MKKFLLLMLGLLYWHSILAQNNSNSSSITTTGISLPQLITANFNRSNLQLGISLTYGYERPDLYFQNEKFNTDDSK